MGFLKRNADIERVKIIEAFELIKAGHYDY